jgi:hypothetical protein
VNPTRCISCGEPMAPGAERAPSFGNPNQCVPCCTGHQLPAEGSAEYRATDGPPTLGREAAGQQSPIPGSGMVPVLVPSSGSLPDASESGSTPDASTTLPPATAPAACISGDAGPETTAAGGNPFPAGRWTDPAARASEACPACGQQKDVDLLVCWPCFKAPGGLKESGLSFEDWISNLPDSKSWHATESYAKGPEYLGPGKGNESGISLVRGCGPTEPAAGAAPKPAESPAAGPGQLCIKCGAPVEDPGLATACCADCRSGFRVPAPRLPEPAWDAASEALTRELRRKGIQSIPADTSDDHAWRMML